MAPTMGWGSAFGLDRCYVVIMYATIIATIIGYVCPRLSCRMLYKEHLVDGILITCGS